MSWLAQSRTVELPEGTIRYRDLGSGMPILFVHGLLAERLAAALPNATIERIHGSRCYVPEDQPALLASKLRGFLHSAADEPASSAGR
jgi:hypothetical protein